MTITMHNPQEVLLRELDLPGITQESVALTYAFIMRQEGDKADWPTINRAIQQRWKGKAALRRIKERAWAIVEGR